MSSNPGFASFISIVHLIVTVPLRAAHNHDEEGLLSKPFPQRAYLRTLVGRSRRGKGDGVILTGRKCPRD